MGTRFHRVSKLAFLIAMGSAFCWGSAHAQNPLVKEGSIGVKPKSKEFVKAEPFPFIPVKNWVGQRFIFLPASKDLQKYGYVSVHLDGADLTDNATYGELVGKIGKVLDMVTDAEQNTGDVRIKIEGSEKIYVANVVDGFITGLALVADIEKARAKWVGKTVWYTGDKLETYDATTGKSSEVSVKKYQAFKVKDIVAGWYSEWPCRLILESPLGKQGYVDVALSGTCNNGALSPTQKYDHLLFFSDPRTNFKWPQRVWSAIEKGRVFVGMTRQQAKFSWGEPKDINSSSNANSSREQWVYGGNSYLYFHNGILESISN